MKVGGKTPTLKHPPTIKRTIVKASFILFCHSLENSPLFKSLMTSNWQLFFKKSNPGLLLYIIFTAKIRRKKGKTFSQLVCRYLILTASIWQGKSLVNV